MFTSCTDASNGEETLDRAVAVDADEALILLSLSDSGVDVTDVEERETGDLGDRVGVNTPGVIKEG